MTKMSRSPSIKLTALEVAKQFYQQFKAEYILFSQQIQGITRIMDRLDYTSLLLNRLLVLYFLQKQCLLDNDLHYLSNRLHRVQQQEGMHCFHCQFLLALFYQLYSVRTESSVQTGLIGAVPPLSLPIFAILEMERTNENLHIPDGAFARIFTFFERYNWQIDASAPRGENELRPDILAYLFERSVDQKRSGAYYTREDITTYIASNTIVACLLTELARSFPHREELNPWHLLQADPDRYIQEAMRSTAYLVEETEIEYQQRRARYTYLYAQLQAGIIQNVDELITYNLDLTQFAIDVIHDNQDHSFIVAIYTRLKNMLILDPTCGTGAFLFSALTTLTLLYRACIERMHEIVARQRRATRKRPSSSMHDIKTTLAEIELHPNPEHFILSTIMTHNLYGVDLMQAAVDICQLRLSLALLATCGDSQGRDHRPVPPMNIRAGNALVGEVRQYTDSSLHFLSLAPMKPTDYTTDNREQDMPALYPLDTPFHWYKEFPVLIERGGFDVIIGNPPYLEYSQVRQRYAACGYEEKSCGNLYAAVIERSLALCRTEQSYLGLIVPISICSSERFAFLRQTLFQMADALWFANFEIFPCRLFENAFQRVSIVLMARHQLKEITTLQVTRTHRWFAQERSHLLQCLTYTKVEHSVQSRAFPKLASLHQAHILQKMLQKADGMKIATFLHIKQTKHFVYYQEATNYWTKAVCRIPYYKKNGQIMVPSHGRFLFLEQEQTARIIMALMNSSLFYIWFTTYADGFHLSHTLVKEFPLSTTLLASQQLYDLALLLEKDIQRHARVSTHNTKDDIHSQQPGHQIELEEYQMRYSKDILDEVDRVLAQHYSFTLEELAFIINYDIKYRLSKRGKK